MMKMSLENPLFPHILQFETNTICNAHCRMCPHDKMQRRGTAKWSLIGKIIREASKHDVEIVCPFLMQEPMLEPRLVPILANIKQRMPRVCTAIYSNMSILSEETIRYIVKYELVDELHISFYGPTEQLYRKWQPPLKRVTTINNIKRLHSYRTKQKCVKPKMTLHVLAVPELVEAAEGYRDVLPYVDEVSTVQYDTFHGDVPDYGGDQTPYFGRSPAPRTPCQRLWTGLTVHCDGNVVPCCIDYQAEHVMGNVYANTLEEIWTNTRFQQFRKLHMAGRWNEIELCRNCVVPDYQFSQEWIDYWIAKPVLAKVVA